MMLKNLFRKPSLYLFLVYFFLMHIGLCFCRLFTTAGSLDLTMWQGYQILASLAFASVCALYNYQKKNTLLFLFCALLFGVASLCRIGGGMALTEREIVQTIGLGIIIYATFAVLEYGFSYIKINYIRRTLKCVFGVLFAVCLLPALLFIGYYIASDGHLLSANILLTIFQTNIGEVYAYLAEQNYILWGFCILLILLVVFVLARLLGTLLPNPKNFKLLLFNTALILYLIFAVVPKLSSSFVVNIFIRVSDTLNEYKQYSQRSAERDARLAKLKEILIKDDTPQLHVLVMGESTVREHLAAFGYKKPTTPWLSKMLKDDPYTIIFPKAYSNNIQTVMSVQFALTSQNQYDKNSSLLDAYSITEIASAADYETYWISNQLHFNAYDTPISAIFNGADKREFINDYYGSKLLTTYYDEKLADHFPKIDKNKKTFIVFHLMGCHNLYIDRYPSSYKTFTDSDDDRVNTYDDCILYNDHVLSALYQKAIENENFMSFTFLSDHGEDPDNGLTHDYSKFTWRMPHIPMLMIFSKAYEKQHPDIVETLKLNHNKYWTSDLLFNTMAHVMGISNVPGENAAYDISRPEYAMNKNNLTIIEGQYAVKDDDSDKD